MVTRRPDPGSNPSTWRLVTRGMWVGRWSPGASGFHGACDVSIGLDQRHGGQLGQGRKVVGLSSSLALRGSWSVWGVITLMELSGDGDPWRPDPGSSPSTWRSVTRGMWVDRWSPGASGFHGAGDVSIGLDQRHGGQLGRSS
jgi:hypothetical protein